MLSKIIIVFEKNNDKGKYFDVEYLTFKVRLSICKSFQQKIFLCLKGNLIFEFIGIIIKPWVHDTMAWPFLALPILFVGPFWNGPFWCKFSLI